MDQTVILTPLTEDAFFTKVKDIVQTVVHSKQQQDFQDKLLSPAEACKIFNPAISKVTLHEWTKQGLIPVYRMGGRIYYRYSEVLESAKRITKYGRDKQPA